ncbi:MAG: hypothetical protein JNN15_20080, partial [Blastocatellia bacterium]|nr:hypothetical protein [Blastocatellia bacterium]
MHKLGRFTLIAAISLLFLFITTSFAQEGGNKNLIAAGDLAYFAGFISENQLQPDMKIVSSITQPYRISLYSGETIYANKGESQ